MNVLKIGVGQIGFRAFSLGLALSFAASAAGGTELPDAPAPVSHPPAQDVQARGQAILRQLIEVNRYWLLVPLEAVTNYAYVFHLRQGEQGNPDSGQYPVRVVEPAKASHPRRQGVTYYSVLQCLAKDPTCAQVRVVTEKNGRITLELAVAPPLRGACGNGVKGSWVGYFSFGGEEAQLVIDAGRMVPLKSVVLVATTPVRIEETFSDYAEVTPGHYAPLSVTVKRAAEKSVQFDWKFKLHDGGLWLFDQGRYRDQKVAWLDQVVVNRPLSELPDEPSPAPRKSKSASPRTTPQYQTFETNGVEVSYAGVSVAYAQAIARTIAVARSIAAEQFGFDMPEVITITVTADADREVQLFNDGEDHFVLDVSSEAGLERPARTGTFHIYGLCHEVGHLAMYRLIKDCDWMKNDAKEAWAHYLGSRLTDMVYVKCGPEIWPDHYDYRADGMQRLEKSLAQDSNTNSFNQAVRAWKALVEIVGDKGTAPLFAAWAKARIDPLDPGTAIRPTLSARPEAERLAAWWYESEPALIQELGKSDFPVETIEASALAGRPVELALDDGQPAGKSSIAGSGHAVRFEANGTNCFLTEVRMFGSRYGLPEPPKENFHVWLCDKGFKPIADFPFPYSSFPYAGEGEGKWVTLKVPPTRVPPEFVICVCFNPTATKGIYANYDKEAGGHSFVALPGREDAPFKKGDWLIRACLDQPRTQR
jgi:hypothetical protein